MTLPKPRAKTILAVIIIIGYILITASFGIVLFFGDQIKLPDGEIGKQIVGMLGMIVGTWNAAVMIIVTYNYGSSQSSSDKNELVKKAIEKESKV